MSEGILIVMALGVLAGMIFYKKTGLSCGGIITPGILALSLNQPMSLVYGLGLSLLVWGVLEGLSRVVTLYGRQRIATAMLLALVIRIVMGKALLSPVMLGWAVPGLIAADFQRQGFFITITSALSNAIIAALAFSAISMIVRWSL